MKKFALIISVLAIPFGIFNFSAVKSADAVTNATAPIVLELFTSQSCSSCPPADKILGEIAQSNENVIALSCHVTYWNHLHWKDTLSKQFCTSRQRGYVRALESRGPYTPQIVVNGAQELVGNRSNAVKRAMASKLKNNPIASIDLNLNGENLKIKLPQIESGNYTLLLLTHGDAHTQAIPSGENRGRTVNYTNPVQEIISLGSWDGSAKTLEPNITELATPAGYVILAQKNGATGNIVAAAQIKR